MNRSAMDSRGFPTPALTFERTTQSACRLKHYIPTIVNVSDLIIHKIKLSDDACKAPRSTEHLPKSDQCKCVDFFGRRIHVVWSRDCPHYVGISDRNNHALSCQTWSGMLLSISSTDGNPGTRTMVGRVFKYLYFYLISSPNA